jgi:opacity protein-like surface antigen
VRFHCFLLLGLLACMPPSTASADWLITPFLGMKFAGQSNFLELEQGAGEKKVTFGGSVAVLDEGLLGLEADFGHTLRFFQRADRGGLVTGSSVTTLMGNVILAAPLGLTRESLRPYLVGGVGWIRASSDDLIQLIEIDSNLFGLDIGFGAIGFITNRTGLRFEFRYFRNLSKEEASPEALGTTRITFWRASAGVTLRY